MAGAEVVNSDRMGSTGYPGGLMKLIDKERFFVTLTDCGVALSLEDTCPVRDYISQAPLRPSRTRLHQ